MKKLSEFVTGDEIYSVDGDKYIYQGLESENGILFVRCTRYGSITHKGISFFQVINDVVQYDFSCRKYGYVLGVDYLTYINHVTDNRSHELSSTQDDWDVYNSKALAQRHIVENFLSKAQDSDEHGCVHVSISFNSDDKLRLSFYKNGSGQPERNNYKFKTRESAERAFDHIKYKLGI